MNKTYLTIGGVAITSLAAGAVGGYFIAKRGFDAEIEEAVAFEVDRVKMHYDAIEAEKKAKEKAASDSSDIPEQGTSVEDEEDEEEQELSEEDKAVIEKGRHRLATASAALVNYQGISTSGVEAEKPALKDVVKKRNIFEDDKAKKALPPRGDKGKFRKKTTREVVHGPPQILDDPEEFLLNPKEYEQENLLYFINDNKTLVHESNPNESEDIARVGEVNLTLFDPTIPEDQPNVIHVRNDGLGVYYEIKLMTESLTEFIGFGENEGGEGLEDDGTSYYHED